MLISFLKKVFKRACLVLLVAGVEIGVPHLAQSNPIAQTQSVWIADPIFSTGYDSRSVHFELLETKTLMPNCKKYLSDIDPLPEVLTLYSSYKGDSTTIYIVGTGDNEKILVLRNGVCHGGIPLLSITQTHHRLVRTTPDSEGPSLTDEEVLRLFEDTLIRHARAFGGKGAFLKWLDETTDSARSGCKGLSDVWCPATYHTLQPILQQILQDYRK